MSVKEPLSLLQLVVDEREPDCSRRGPHHFVHLPSEGADPNCDPGHDTAEHSSS